VLHLLLFASLLARKSRARADVLSLRARGKRARVPDDNHE
jgi:hypothetical protein